MEQDKKRTWGMAKQIGIMIGILLLLYLLVLFINYFMPFFIAGILALLMEPIIKFLMEKLKMSRRLSSIIIITVTIILMIGFVVWGGIFAINELVKFSKDIGPMISNIITTIETQIGVMAQKLKEYIPEEVIDSILSSITGFVTNAGSYIQTGLGKVMEFVLSVPTILLNVIVTILALIFFAKDRIYLLDTIEHHFPKKWIKNVSDILNEIFSTFGSYIKVYGKILIITFAELFLGFAILKAIGFALENVFLLSVIIAIVDILPILGVGTVLIPWFLWEFAIGNVKFGLALGILYFIILIIRQLIEPKLVSKQLGIHPLITLFAMYAGFKIFGFTGLIFGPILLMILRCIFEKFSLGDGG